MKAESEIIQDPFHPGEQRMQAKAGKRHKLETIGRRVIRPYMPEQHREFFQNLPFLLVGSVAGDGRPWASVLFGTPGFVHAPEATVLEIHAQPADGDPLAGNLHAGAALGFLGLEFHSRRRNRMNGKIIDMDDNGSMRIRVDQSFGNCPKYIQARNWQWRTRNGPGPAAPTTASHLLKPMRRIVENADTFFIASAYEAADHGATASAGVDVSHRGGRRGFVQVRDEHHLLFPDYSGNFFYNTLGNLLENPRAGLLFMDFENGHILQLSGETAIIEDDRVQGFPGAERLLEVRIQEALLSRHRMPLCWSAAVESPFLPAEEPQNSRP